jgi:hypothetical protein
MGVELQSMHTALTVEQALEMLGLRVTLPGARKGKGKGEDKGEGKGDGQGEGRSRGDDRSFEGREGQGERGGYSLGSAPTSSGITRSRRQ